MWNRRAASEVHPLIRHLRYKIASANLSYQIQDQLEVQTHTHTHCKHWLGSLLIFCIFPIQSNEAKTRRRWKKWEVWMRELGCGH